MKKQIIRFLSVMTLVSILAVPAFAGGTAEEAKAMVEKAAAFIKANGKEKAFAEFTNQKGAFINKDLYIFIVDQKGITLAHGGNAKLVGKNMMELKDADGKLFIKEMADLAKTKGSGWVDYKWVNPETKAIQPKSTYIQAVDDYFIGCGIYK